MKDIKSQTLGHMAEVCLFNIGKQTWLSGSPSIP